MVEVPLKIFYLDFKVNSYFVSITFFFLFLIKKNNIVLRMTLI